MTQDFQALVKESVDVNLKKLLGFLTFASIYLILIIPVQGIFFMVSPPPETVLGFFELFQENMWVGFIHLDLLLTVDYLIILLVYFLLFFILKRKDFSLSLIALIIASISLILYIVSREGTFTMLALSNQYFATEIESEKAAILASGKTMLAIFNGSSFDISYVMGGVSMFLFSLVMKKDELFPKALWVTGIITALFMLVPPTVGEIGIWISMISLIPCIIWLIMLTRWFFKVRKTLA